MRQRVLVLSASVGGGHVRAAEAVEAALRIVAPDVDVENHDVLEFTNSVFRRVYRDTYLDLVNRAPYLLGMVYDWLDRAPESPRDPLGQMRRKIERLNILKLKKFIADGKWNLVINTHFLPAQLIARLRSKNELTLPQVTVCTDFDTHRMWVNQPCDLYFCAIDEGAAYLQYLGVPVDDVRVTGIPVHPRFDAPVDRTAWLARHNLRGDRPLVLQLCGGFGVGPVTSIYEGLLALPQSLEIVCVCGRNDLLRQSLAEISIPERHVVQHLGFTHDIDELMGCADLIVSKPGGLTTSETLARGVPMAIVNPIPGQEARNSDYLLEQGVATKINHPALLTLKISRLLNDPQRLATLRAAARRAGRPRAAFDVVAQSLDLIGVKCDSLKDHNA